MHTHNALFEEEVCQMSDNETDPFHERASNLVVKYLANRVHGGKASHGIILTTQPLACGKPSWK